MSEWTNEQMDFLESEKRAAELRGVRAGIEAAAVAMDAMYDEGGWPDAETSAERLRALDPNAVEVTK